MNSSLPIQGKVFPSTPEVQAARKRALVEVQKLDSLLTRLGHEGVAPIEQPMLMTYIMSKDLGWLDDQERVDG